MFPSLYFGLLVLFIGIGFAAGPGARKVGLWTFCVAGALFGLGLWLASGVMMGGSILAAFSATLLFPVFVTGVGLAIGGTVRLFHRRGRTRMARVLGLGSILVPGLALILQTHQFRAAQAARDAQLATFQGGSLAGTLGGTALRLPASPVFETSHACASPGGTCRTFFRRSGDRLQNAATDGVSHITFTQIETVPVHASCDGDTAPLNACIPTATMRAWCDRRTDYADTILCRNPPTQQVRFFPASDPPRHGQAFEASQWRDEPIDPLGSDAQGNPIRLACNSTRDQVTSRRQDGYRLCRVNFALSPGIKAEIELDRIAPAAMTAEAHRHVAKARQLWAVLVGRD